MKDWSAICNFVAAEKVRIIRRAAEHGFSEAQKKMGDLYRLGRLVPKDPAEAVKWYRLAAAQGDPPAQYSLGVMCSLGIGTARDPAAAAQWWHQAAEQGHIAAQYNLAVAFANGTGVVKDPVEARHWYREAARQGDGEAELVLEGLEEYGDGQTEAIGVGNSFRCDSTGGGIPHPVLTDQEAIGDAGIVSVMVGKKNGQTGRSTASNGIGTGNSDMFEEP